MSTVLTLAVHAHVPWRRGTVAEAAPHLQRGPSRGGQGVGSQDPARASLCPWHLRGRHVRVCALPVPASHSRPRRASKQDCLCTHTLTHLYTKHSTTHIHHAHTHTIMHTRQAHTRHHIHMHSCVQTPSWKHTPSRAHTRSCTLPRVHLTGGGLGGGADTPLSREEDPPRTAGHCRTTPHAHSSCYQHPIQKTVLIRKSANGSLQLLIASLIWDFFQGGTE